MSEGQYRKVMVRGTPRYLGPNNKFVKAENVPEAVLIRLRQEEFVDTTPVVVDKSCIFCGRGDCRQTRLVNTQTIYLCEEDYYDKTIGKVAQKLKELKNAVA